MKGKCCDCTYSKYKTIYISTCKLRGVDVPAIDVSECRYYHPITVSISKLAIRKNDEK